MDNYLLDEKVYDRISMMKERLLLAVPASFSSNRRASTYQLTVNDIINDVHLNPSFPAVPLKKFQDEPFMVMRQNNDTRDRVEAICKRAAVRDVYLFYRRNRYLTRSMEEFMKIVLEEQPEEVII